MQHDPGAGHYGRCRDLPPSLLPPMLGSLEVGLQIDVLTRACPPFNGVDDGAADRNEGDACSALQTAMWQLCMSFLLPCQLVPNERTTPVQSPAKTELAKLMMVNSRRG